MIDIHSHIAWGIDDGFPDEAAARTGLATAARGGITRICSTPHLVPSPSMAEDLRRIDARQALLEKTAREYGIRIDRGAEVMINSEFIDRLSPDRMRPLGGSRYLLLEFDIRKDIHRHADVFAPFYEASVAGFRPVIAHVERYFHHGLDRDILDGWKKEGYVFQINRTSLLDPDDRTIRRNAWALITEGYAHVAATDAHRPYGRRTEQMKDAYDAVLRRCGAETARRLFIENPSRILEDRDVLDISPEPSMLQKLSGRIMRRGR